MCLPALRTAVFLIVSSDISLLVALCSALTKYSAALSEPRRDGDSIVSAFRKKKKCSQEALIANLSLLNCVNGRCTLIWLLHSGSFLLPKETVLSTYQMPPGGKRKLRLQQQQPGRQMRSASCCSLFDFWLLCVCLSSAFYWELKLRSEQSWHAVSGHQHYSNDGILGKLANVTADVWLCGSACLKSDISVSWIMWSSSKNKTKKQNIRSLIAFCLVKTQTLRANRTVSATAHLWLEFYLHKWK